MTGGPYTLASARFLDKARYHRDRSGPGVFTCREDPDVVNRARIARRRIELEGRDR